MNAKAPERKSRSPEAGEGEQRLESVAFENLGAGVDSPGVRDDPLSLLSLQERSLDSAWPDDEVPKAIKLLNVDDHVSVPRTCVRVASRDSAALFVPEQ